MLSSTLLSLVLAAAALAVPPPTPAVGGPDPYPQNWGGAILANFNNNTWKSVTASFTVPTPQVPSGESFNSTIIHFESTAFVGLDGVPPCNASLQGGVDSILDKSGNFYYVPFWQWTGANSKQAFTNGFTAKAGDVVTFTVTAISPTSGSVSVSNTNSNPTTATTGTLVNYPALCLATAEWIVNEDEPSAYTPLANFTQVTFTGAQAQKIDGTVVGPSNSGAVLINIDDNGNILTHISTTQNTVTVTYV